MYQNSIFRILIDLVKADSVIEATEIEDIKRLKNKYRVGDCDLKLVANLTLADAVKDLQENGFNRRKEFLDDIINLTVVDGFCVKREALFLMALHYCLSKGTKERSEVISINAHDIAISEDQVLYVESADKGEGANVKNMDIEEDFRKLNTEFKVSGLNFFYIPKIAEHYRNTEENTFKDICSFLAPDFSKAEIDGMYSYITNVTTKKFCNEQLFGKLGMSSIYNTKASFLVHIGTSFVNHKLYNNFLKVEFEQNRRYSEQLLEFLDSYTKYLSYDVVVIPKADDVRGHFLYSGFYKYVFDLYLRKDQRKSSICIDLIKQDITFPEIGDDFKLKVTRREKAIYAMLLLERENEAIDFLSDDENSIVFRKFKFLYRQFGGDEDKVPDITKKENLKPILSHIKKFFSTSMSLLKDHTHYMIKKSDNNSYILRSVFLGDVYVRTLKCGDDQSSVLLQQSELLRRYKQIK